MLVDHGALSESPVEKIALPKKDPAERLLVSDEELARLPEAAGRQTCAWRAARDQAAVAVLIYTGLRRAEVIGLRVGDLDLAGAKVQVVHGKGNKSRTVPLCPDAVPYLSRWLELRPEVQHEYLFVTGDVRRLAEYGLRASAGGDPALPGAP